MGRSVELVFILGVGFFVVGWAIQYLYQYWMSHIKKTNVQVPFWVCGIFGIFASLVFIGWVFLIWAVIQYVLLKFTKESAKK